MLTYADANGRCSADVVFDVGEEDNVWQSNVSSSPTSTFPPPHPGERGRGSVTACVEDVRSRLEGMKGGGVGGGHALGGGGGSRSGGAGGVCCEVALLMQIGETEEVSVFVLWY
jgi:hypothetical protein